MSSWYDVPEYSGASIYDTAPQEEFTLAVGAVLNEQLQFGAYSAIVDNPTTQPIHIKNTNHYVPAGATGYVVRLPGVGRAEAEFAAPPGVALPPALPGRIALLIFTRQQLQPGGATSSVSITASGTTFTATTVPVAATSAAPVQLMPVNTQRVAGSIFNGGTTNLYILFGAVNPSVALYSVKMVPGSYFELPGLGVAASGVFPGLIWGIWDGAPAGAAQVSELAP